MPVSDTFYNCWGKKLAIAMASADGVVFSARHFMKHYSECGILGGVMDWNSIISDVFSGSILLGLGSICGWLAGIAKGKKKSSLAIERKDTLYQPLLDELSAYSDFKWDIYTEIKANHLHEIVNNQYKYGLNDSLLQKCLELNNLIEDYIRINPIAIAYSIIVKIFETAYKEIYGSVVDGIINHCDRDGNEWDEEVMVAPLICIERTDFSKIILKLLKSEEMHSEQVCVDYENDIYLPIYSQLKNIYASALYARVNGKKFNLPSPKIELNMLPEEYMALNYDFFLKYNTDKRIIDKYSIRKNIIYLNQSIIQELKEIIKEIVKVYEVEQI